MKYVIAPLRSGAQGQEVNNLNKCLVFLLVKKAGIIDRTPLYPGLSLSQLKDLINQSMQQYGPITESLILLFQKNQHLAETGEVNKETADKLNSVLNNKGAFDQQTQYKISSQAFDSLGEHITQQKVVGFDVDLQHGRLYKTIDTLKQVQGIASNLTKLEGSGEVISAHPFRLSVKDGEYTYAKPDDIIMIESRDHLTIVHVAQRLGKVKTTIRNSCLKNFLLDLPKNYFLRLNRFCAVNVNRLSGGSYHQQYLEFDYCIKVKPRQPLSHAVFNSIGR